MDRRLFVLLVCVLSPCRAQDVLPEQDDASLRSVFFTTSTNGCAVGERGVIWRTQDGGLNWSLVPSPVVGLHDCTTFVNSKVGWIVGSRTMPQNGIALGYVLRTDDGGASWKMIAGRPTEWAKGRLAYLPRLRSVRFFTPKLGFAVGDANGFYASGVMKTEDGGTTWSPLEGDASEWQCAWFMNPDTGFVAGRGMTQGSIRSDKVVAGLEPLAGRQSWRAVRVSSTSTSWLVGDGAQVLCSEDAGVTWRDPVAALPEALREFADFYAVAARGQKVWIAGSPGSVVWHSPDAGETWTAFETGQSVPIRSIFFRSESQGYAVGDLGMVLATVDGGRTWQSLRGGQRRLAMLAISPRVSRVPFELVLREAGESGYRSGAWVPSPGVQDELLDDRLREAASEMFGSVGEIGWRFPVRIEGAERSAARLVAEWQDRTEGKLGRQLLAMLVGRLRTHRPDVVIVNATEKTDAVSQLLADATRRAVTMAADASQFSEQLKFGKLKPWQAKRVFERLNDGDRGQIEIASHDLLRLRGGTVGDLASPVYMLMSRPDAQTSANLAFRRVLPPLTEGETRGGFFRGLGLAPGSDARRKLVVLREDAQEALVKSAERQRNFAGYVGKFLGDERQAGQVLAQLDDVVKGLSDDAAARQLQLLAREYDDVEQFSLSAATRLQLVKRYPKSVVASNARLWLIRYWSAAEPAWQRQRRASVDGAIQLASASHSSELKGVIRPADHPSFSEAQAAAAMSRSIGTEAVAAARRDTRSTLTSHWRDSAMKMSGELKHFDPLRFQLPETQLSVAALMRGRGAEGGATTIYSGEFAEPWKSIAAREVWLSRLAGSPPESSFTIRFTPAPPELDGILSDPCWQRASELWLRGENIDTRQGSYAAAAYDDKYLYIAAAVRRHKSTTNVETKRGGRRYDADLGNHDRLVWTIDVDRDYATAYRFEVDQRGQTTDACWIDKGWNPKWYVAAESDRTHWRVEAAIPLDELVPAAPKRMEAWAIGIKRILPGYGASTWAKGESGLGLFGQR